MRTSAVDYQDFNKSADNGQFDKAILELLKWGGIHSGFVTDIDDPKRLNRVRAEIYKFRTYPEGQKNTPTKYITDWLYPAGLYVGGVDEGISFPVPINSPIIIMFEDLNTLKGYFWYGSHYVGTKEDEYFSGVGSSFPEVNAKDPRKVRIIRTASGHEIIFNDNSGENSLTISDSIGNIIELNSPLVTEIRAPSNRKLRNKKDLSFQDLKKSAQIIIRDFADRQGITVVTSEDPEKSFIKIKADNFKLEVNGNIFSLDNKGNILKTGNSEINIIKENVKEKIGSRDTEITGQNSSIILGLDRKMLMGGEQKTNLSNSQNVKVGDSIDLVDPAHKHEIGVQGSSITTHNALSIEQNTKNYQLNADVKADIKAPLINLADATTPAVLGLQLEAYINTQLVPYLTRMMTSLGTHIHNTTAPGSPTTPSIPPFLEPPPVSSGILSAKVKLS